MRLLIASISALALGCLAGGLAVFSGRYTPPGTLSTSDLRLPVVALGLIFTAIVGERLAVGLAFIHSRRNVGQISTLLLAACCLLMMLDSLFFALRVRGALTTSWTLLGLPIEEALPPIEVTLFAPLALGYSAWPPVSRLVSGAARVGRSFVAGRDPALQRRQSAQA